jgi:hypothetical protein
MPHFFNDIIKPLIQSATKINHYPELNKFEFVDKKETILLSLYTQKTSEELAKLHRLQVDEYKKNRYNKYILTLKIS